MKRFMLNLALCLIATLAAYAIDTKPRSNFKEWSARAEKEGINVTLPKGYKNLPFIMQNIGLNPNFRPKKYLWGKIWPYSVAIQSPDNNCLFLYPELFKKIPTLDSSIEAEIVNFFDDEDMDVTNYLTKIDANQGVDISNADYALFYKTVSPMPIYGQYTYLMNICLRKQNHPGLLLKIAMNEDGIKNVDKYVETLLKSIKYTDEPTEYFKQWPDIPNEYELKFPIAKKSSGNPIHNRSLDTHPYEFKLNAKKAEQGNYDPFKEYHILPKDTTDFYIR